MRGRSWRQGQQAKAGKAEHHNSLHVILPGRQSLPQRRLASTLPNAARAKSERPNAAMRSDCGSTRNLAASWDERAWIQGKRTSGRLYLNKLLRRRGDASLAILTYHFERASYSVQ
jgi:hypothetical protein